MNSEMPVREITDGEVAFYDEHGWVKLDGLLSRESAAELLDASEALLRRVQRDPESCEIQEMNYGTRQVIQTPDWRGSLLNLTSGGQVFTARNLRFRPFLPLVMGQGLGRVAHRLINRAGLTDEHIGVRFMEDTVICKPGATSDAPNPTFYHQDQPQLGVDRVGTATIWIALNEVTPEQGSMRFLDRSHRAGPLGGHFGMEDLLQRYPKLAEKYELSPPLHYQPGDATVHHQLTIHGAPANSTARPRWAFTGAYMAADCVVEVQDGRALGMPEPHERYPMVYT